MMILRFATSLFAMCAVACAVSVSGQSTQATANSNKRSAYETLLERLTAGDTKIDFGVLRLAYAETASANPYGTSHETRRRMNAAVIEQRCDEALKIADQILSSNYLSPDTHIAKSTCYRRAGDSAKADLHKAIYLGLINSIVALGDGLKPETAYRVISIEEEYAVMRALGLTVWKQEQFRRGEHAYEVLSGTNDKAGKSITIYFNIDIPAALERRKGLK